MSEESYSRSTLVREKDELRKDLIAFSHAYETLRRRVLDSNELEIPRRPLLHEWSGTRAVIGSLEMAIHAIERTLAGTAEILRQIDRGEIHNTDPSGHPGLGIVDGGKNGMP